jgi:hypothetical protein
MYLTMAQCWSIATAMVRGRTDYSTSELSLYANLALQEMASRSPHRPLESATTLSITSGTTTYSLPSDFESVIALSTLSTDASEGRGKNLDQKDAPWMDSQGTESGTPSTFALYGNALVLWPVANSNRSYLLRYQAVVPTLVSSASTAPLGERYGWPWAVKTAELLAAARNDIEIEAMCRNRYLSVMGSTPSDQAHRQRDKGNMRVRFQRNAE